MINKVVLIGRLTKDPELKYIQSGSAVCQFTLAVDKGLSKQKKQEYEAQNKPIADFPRIIVWGKQAESVSRYLSKGNQCAIDGRIETGSYQDKDGKTVFTTDIVAFNVVFLNDKENTQVRQNKGNRMENRSNDDDFFDDDFEEMKDDGRIPF